MNDPPDKHRDLRIDAAQEAQLLRDLAIANVRTIRELGPLPAGGLLVEPKRRPNLTKSIADIKETPTMSNSERRSAVLSNGQPAPPIPKGLQERLSEYPDYLERLQLALNRVIEKPSRVAQPLEVAIWELEDALGGFLSEAHNELKAAEIVGDEEVIERAKEKRRSFGSARADMGSLSELRAYFSDGGEK